MNDSNDIYKNYTYLCKTTPTDLAIKNPPHRKDFQKDNTIDYSLNDLHQNDLNEDTDTLSYFLFI